MRIQLEFFVRLFRYYLCILHRYLVEWKNILQLLFLVKDNPPQYILALRSFLVLIRGPETLTDDERLSKLRIFMICWCQVTYLSCSLDGHTRSFCKRGKRGVHIEYRTHTNSEPGHYFHARHLGGLVIEFSARDLLLEKVFYFDGKKYDQGSCIIYSKKVLQENSSPVHYWCAYGMCLQISCLSEFHCLS